MELKRSEFNVVDVYELATKIGREFEELIDIYGPDCIGGLMPQVIHCLEHLEVLASQNHNEQLKITELSLLVEKLTDEKFAKAKERDKYEKDIESTEESWRIETANLVRLVAQLEKDNVRLKNSLHETKGQVAKVKRDEDEEVKLVSQMKEKLDQQARDMRHLKNELSNKNLDVQTLQSQLERMAKLTAEYRRKTTINQRQAVQLISDKTQLQSQLHAKEKQICLITRRMERSTSGDGTLSPMSEDEMTSIALRLADEGKMLVDLDDPDRPRYSLTELESVMTERNELKTKLIELEDDLAHYKKIEEQEELEPAVQGPINKEPEEKLYPNRLQNSKIRKLLDILKKPTQSAKSSNKPAHPHIETSTHKPSAADRRRNSSDVKVAYAGKVL